MLLFWEHIIEYMPTEVKLGCTAECELGNNQKAWVQSLRDLQQLTFLCLGLLSK